MQLQWQFVNRIGLLFTQCESLSNAVRQPELGSIETGKRLKVDSRVTNVNGEL